MNAPQQGELLRSSDAGSPVVFGTQREVYDIRTRVVNVRAPVQAGIGETPR